MIEIGKHRVKALPDWAVYIIKYHVKSTDLRRRFPCCGLFGSKLHSTLFSMCSGKKLVLQFLVS